MLSVTAKILLLLHFCGLCSPIRVPVSWNNDSFETQFASDSKESAVHSDASSQLRNNDGNREFAVETFEPQNINVQSRPTTTFNLSGKPTEYFEYPAVKPQFAINVAAFHGVKSPEKHYRAYPIVPHTNNQKPVMGIHYINSKNKPIFESLQKFTKSYDGLNRHLNPTLSNYEVHHPYKAEEPALIELYKDPILLKIKNDIKNNNAEHNEYQKQVENINISDEEHLRNPEDTDNEKFPQKNIGAKYETYKPQRKPFYYRVPPKMNREKYFKKKFRHPWNHNFAKVMPAHYRPLQNHLHNLQQHHAQKYDDEYNEYPQIINHNEQNEEPTDGYDIYLKGKDKYTTLKNNVDHAINQAIRVNRPKTHEKLELQNSQTEDEDSYDNDEEFVPIKNYAQVRKTETTKHLPKEAAIHEATTFDELRNAPRLKEAIKSTKAQTIYTEEGYEDSAYDHAGELKHASDHEGHGGYLKEDEISKGKYKAPSWSASYEDGKGSNYGDIVDYGKKWINSDKDTEEHDHSEDLSEDDHTELVTMNKYDNNDDKNESYEADRKKRYDLKYNDTTNHDLNKREVDFKVPSIDLKNTYLTEEEIIEISKEKVGKQKDNLKLKYPYYFKNSNKLNKNSPLRYSENLKLIPNKSQGGTEFYDSRSLLECPEVDSNVDPIPEKIKNDSVRNNSQVIEGDVAENSTTRSKRDVEQENEVPRLQGLGDKIDCFKAKYFGENPLDSPFFNERIIANPDPISVPVIPSYKLITNLEHSDQEPKSNNVFSISEKLRASNEKDAFDLLEKLKQGQWNLQEQLQNTNNRFKLSLHNNKSSNINNRLSDQSNVYTDVIQNIRNTLTKPEGNDPERITINLLHPLQQGNGNISYKSFKNKDDVIKAPLILRRKRDAFVYEPYKVIRDNNDNESKKITTLSNISPLIKQLQSSRRVESSSTKDIRRKTTSQPVKRNVATKKYKDINKEDRQKNSNKNDKEHSNKDDKEHSSKNEKEHSSTNEKESNNAKFDDVSITLSRSNNHSNHKPKYSPIEIKKYISIDDYLSKQRDSNTERDKLNKDMQTIITREAKPKLKERSSTEGPYFKNLSKKLTQSSAASETVRKIVKPMTGLDDKEDFKRKNPLKTIPKGNQRAPLTSEESDEDYENDDEKDEVTKRSKIIDKKRNRQYSTTTQRPIKIDDKKSKLRMTTRFNKNPQYDAEKENNNNNERHSHSPVFTEKSKKSSKDTLVTDSKTYGEGNDDMRKEEVDALIEVKHDSEYVPSYEKENNNKPDNDTEDEYDDEEESQEEDDEYNNSDDDESDEDFEGEDEDEEDEDEDKSKEKLNTDKDKTTSTESIDHKNDKTPEKQTDHKPIVIKKKIEIHKELPVNKSLPHFIQFKQDIKEEETIKQMPRKHTEALDLYKDENLARNVNKLADIEIFKTDLDIHKGPKHGGNYRVAKVSEMKGNIKENNKPKNNHLRMREEDADVSQTKHTRIFEFDDVEDDVSKEKMHGGNLKSYDDHSSFEPEVNDGDYRNEKFTELVDENKKTHVALHGGNLRSINDATKKGQHKSRVHRNHRGIEEIDNVDDEKPTDSARENRENEKLKSKINVTSNKRVNSADLLNSFAQAVPILTTTPAYILDPSKRMYYYVDA